MGLGLLRQSLSTKGAGKMQPKPSRQVHESSTNPIYLLSKMKFISAIDLLLYGSLLIAASLLSPSKPGIIPAHTLFLFEKPAGKLLPA